MAHQFESGFFTGRGAWHGLGTVLESPPTIAEAITAAGLDWQVEEKPIFFGDGQRMKKVDSHKSLIRSTDQKVLGVVGSNYQPLQNSEAFSFFDFLLHDNDVSLEAAGSLREGKRVWVLAKINNLEKEVSKGDSVKPYLLLSNSHDGSLAVWIQFTPIRVVCANTLSAAMRSRKQEREDNKALRIRHQGNMDNKMAIAKQSINFAKQNFEESIEQYQLMANRSIKSFEIDSYLAKIFNKESPEQAQDMKAYEQIIANFEKGRGNKGSTVWDAYNGVTEFLDYQRGKSDVSRLNSAWFGDSARLRTKAHSEALVLI